MWWIIGIVVAGGAWALTRKTDEDDEAPKRIAPKGKRPKYEPPPDPSRRPEMMVHIQDALRLEAGTKVYVGGRYAARGDGEAGRTWRIVQGKSAMWVDGRLPAGTRDGATIRVTGTIKVRNPGTRSETRYILASEVARSVGK
ncbi:MAG: hypothetical protein ABIE42_09250 [Candidatus Eisenbacteria bacterium]